MKTHHITDEDIQRAIDAACKEAGRTYRATLGTALWLSENMPDTWKDEQPARLALLKSALDHLPDSPPPVVDGKTPGEVMFKHHDSCLRVKWEDCQVKERWESAASAVLAAFGNKPQEIPWTPHEGGPCPLKDEEVLEWEYENRFTHKLVERTKPSALRWHHLNLDGDIIAYRVTKWKPGFGPDVDWKAKYEDAKAELSRQNLIHADAIAYANSNPAFQGYCDGLRTDKEKAEAELARIVAAAHEAGWNGVENSKDLAQFIRYLAEDEAKAKADLARVRHIYDSRAIEESERPQLSTLHPISEAGPVPAGCVRIRGFKDHGEWHLATWNNSEDTNFADIRLPAEGQAPAAEAAKPETFTAQGKTWTRHTPGDPMPCDRNARVSVLINGDDEPMTSTAQSWFWGKFAKPEGEIIGWRYADEPTPEEPVKPWTPAVGDVVTLKSGGPKMTVSAVGGLEVKVHGFKGESLVRSILPIATLQLA